VGISEGAKFVIQPHQGYALITGASSGIGSDLARIFAREGHNLVLTARGQERLESLAVELRGSSKVEVVVVPADLSQPGAAERLVALLDDKNIEVGTLVNNAGFGLWGPFLELDANRQGEMIRLNIAALTELTRLLAPAMVKRGKGKILNVASTAAFQPGPLMAVYFATKAYVLSFSMALREELKGTGVSVTCLCPGSTATRFAETSSMDESRFYNLLKPMSSMEVAEIGYRALQRGEDYRVAGWVNRFQVFLTRFSSIRLAAKLAKKIMGKSK
jgi:short-subunit dehydrogenase